VSEPVVTYKETVSEESSVVCLSKSQNKHNRLYAKAMPLENEITAAIEDKTIDTREDIKELAKNFNAKYGWDL